MGDPVLGPVLVHIIEDRDRAPVADIMTRMIMVMGVADEAVAEIIMADVVHIHDPSLLPHQCAISPIHREALASLPLLHPGVLGAFIPLWHSHQVLPALSPVRCVQADMAMAITDMICLTVLTEVIISWVAC